MSLEYTIKRDEARRETDTGVVVDAVRFRAEPSEWACNVRGEVVLRERFESDLELPSIRYLDWSMGARDWTVEDARKFFHAGLRLLDTLEQELAYQKSKKAYEAEAREK